MRLVDLIRRRTLPTALLGTALLCFVGVGQASQAKVAAPAAVSDPAALVNVFVGTSGTRIGGPIDTFPGASVPFGMIQWSPDTPSAPAGGGYDYADHVITGFSLTHLSGPGCSVAGDIRILPTSGAVHTPADARHAFSHHDEHAAPGWYAVQFKQAHIGAQLTVTRRSGLGRFTFPTGPSGNVLFDVSSNQAGVTAAHFRVDGPRQVSGSATAGAFCGAPDTYTVYFVARFNRPMSAYGTWRRTHVMPGKRHVHGINSGGWVSFPTAKHHSVEVEVAISYVSRADALENLHAAHDLWRFNATRQRATDIWNGLLRRIEISGGTRAQRATFYTALYHTLLSPTLYSDVNGEYRGFDGKIHRVPDGHAEYANYSGWDIYRTEVPLIALLAPHRVSDMMQSLLDEAHQGGWLAKWPLENGYTGVMGGDAADIILAGGWAFGARAFNVHEALHEMVKGATDTESPPGQGWYVERPGLRQYLDKGYIDDDLTTSAAPVPNGSSETLEYAEDDFSIARLAGEDGAMAIARRFLRRSMNWQNVFDTATGSSSARDASGAFVNTPINSNGQRGFQEGNAAQYTWMVPQDLRYLIDAMGGRARARRRLNTFFSHLNAGQSVPYAWLGNEPSLGSPWVYLAAGAPWRAEKVVRQALNTLYHDSPSGIPGNDDLGTMSAWYVWSAIGLYPQIPAVRGLDIGSPLFTHVTVTSPGGPTIQIDAPRAGTHRPYVQHLTLNGHVTQHTWLTLPLKGTVRLHFSLARTPNLLWGTGEHDAPPSFTAGAPHFPPAVAANLRPAAHQSLIRPGHSARVAFTVSASAKAKPLAVQWHAEAPAGLHLRHGSGHFKLHPGATHTVHLTLTATGTLVPGYYDLTVRAQAANGAQLPTRKLVVRAAPPGKALALLYVASTADNTIIPFDPATGGTGAPIAVGHNPMAVVASAHGRRIYVANQGSNSVSVLNGRSHQVIATLPVGNLPGALALSANGHTLWVANSGGDTIESIDTATLKPDHTITVGKAPSALVLAPDGKTLYVANERSDTISVISTGSASVRATDSAGAGPVALAISPHGRTLYVADTLAHEVTPIKTATGRAASPIATGLSPRSLALSADGSRLYVANSAVDTLSVIDTRTGQAGKPIVVGRGPFAVTIGREGKKIYALNSQSGRCAVIDARSERVLHSIPVGPFPVALSGPHTG